MPGHGSYPSPVIYKSTVIQGTSDGRYVNAVDSIRGKRCGGPKPMMWFLHLPPSLVTLSMWVHLTEPVLPWCPKRPTYCSGFMTEGSILSSAAVFWFPFVFRIWWWQFICHPNPVSARSETWMHWIAILCFKKSILRSIHSKLVWMSAVWGFWEDVALPRLKMTCFDQADAADNSGRIQKDV